MSGLKAIAKTTIATSFLLVSLLVSLNVAHAQVTIEIGVSKAKATRAMINQGYSQIEIFKKGFKTIQARACQNGTRYKVKVDSKYRIKNTQKIGSCRNDVAIERIEENLARQGYSRIVMDNQNGKYIAIACYSNERVRMTFSQQGKLLQRRVIGECEKIFEPSDVRQVLRDQGYNRIKFTDRQLPWYGATACKNNRHFDLLLTRYGEIRKKTRIGRCDPPINPDKLANMLREKGYERIEIIDDELPVYKAEACFQDDRVELQIDRFGTITGRKVTGKCRARMTKEEIVDVLKQEGFTRISVNRRNNGQFDITACFEGYQRFARLSKFGELISEEQGRKCESRKVEEIFNKLQQRGFDKIEFSAEACRNGKRFKLFYSQSGDRIRRERIGSC